MTREKTQTGKERTTIQQKSYPDGSVYIGNLVNGQRYGGGTLKYPANHPTNRAIYTGEWKNDKMFGKGQIIYIDGILFEGEFADNETVSNGKVKFPDGSVYVGEVMDEKLNGYGVCAWADGTVYEGEWENDKMSGKGTVMISGIKHEGVWKDGEIVCLDKWGPMTFRKM